MTSDYEFAPRERSKRLHDHALDVFPGGVSHNIRYHKPYPIYIDNAQGAYIRDVDGNEYVDFWMNHMSSLLGHSHPDVVEAVVDQAKKGLHFGTVNEKALLLGEKVKEYVPSAERVRFCASGTEATMYAVRLARAFTGKPRILKVEGGWHGGNTDLSKAIHTPFTQQETAGLPPKVMDVLHGFPVNDEEAVNELFNQYGDEIAAVIIEPMLLAGGGVTAKDDFLEYLREKTREYDCLLIFDEVVTGFRVSPGSYQARVDILPDITTLGKFLGGGLPVGALSGRSAVFEAARPDFEGDPQKKVLAGGGTFSMNPMTATAGLASIDVIENEPVYEYTESQAQRVRNEVRDLFSDIGVDVNVLGTSSMFLQHFTSEPDLDTVEDVETLTDRKALREFHLRLFDDGHYFLPGHMGAVSFQTSEEDLDNFLESAEAIGKDMQREGRF